MARRLGLDYSPERVAKIKKKFLEGIAAGLSRSRAAKAAKSPLATIERWRYRDPMFAMDYQAAKGEAIAALEEVVTRRVIEGDDEPVIHQGQQTFTICQETGHMVPFTVKKYDTQLQLFMLRALDPERFCPNVRADYFKRFIQPKDESDGSETFDENELSALVEKLEAAARNKAAGAHEDEGATE